MSTKDLFNKNNKVLTKSDSEKIKREIESFELIKDEMESRKRIRPLVDYSDPANFAKYGSSVKYYEDSFARVYKTYPYDGSLSEKKKWLNLSSDLDLWILANVYPKFVGHIRLSNTQQVFVKGGPNNQPGVVEGEREELSKQYPVKQGNSNIWNPKIYRNSNIYIDPTIGNTVEFWAKVDQDVLDAPVPFKLFSVGNENGEKYSIRYYPDDETLRPTVIDDTTGVQIEDSFYDYPSFIETSWNHYAFSFSNIEGNITIEVYKNGALVSSHTGNGVGTPSSQVSTYLYINGDSAGGSADGLYIDEFRYWKTRRTEQDVGRYWFTDISGGTNTDDNKYSEENRNVDIGVYLKFNEGIIGDADIDSTALDYSGRISNGTITNYSKDVRRLTSAIDESTNTDEKESPDPLLYPNHQDYISTLEYYTNLAMIHDTRNNSSIYHTLPGWVTDEDSVSGENIKELTQVLSSFFDDFHLKVENLPNLGKKDYYSLKDDVDKPSYLAKIGLKSMGFETPDIFTEASLIEDILSRGEQYSFEEKLEDIKNTIYQNIYNNLSYIYKSKGTEKSFRNLIRCFGVDDELVRVNIYSNNSDYTVEEESSRRTSYTKKNFVDFNNPARNGGSIQTEQDPNNPDTTIGYIRGAYNNWNYISSTVETEVLFPKRISEDSPAYFSTPNLEENILSVLRRDNNSELLSVVAYKQGTAASNSVKFNLTLDGLGSVETPYFHDVYENSRFNIAVRLKPVLESPDSSMLGQQNISYVAELYCVRMLGDTIEDESVVSLDLVDYDGTIISKDKILKLGETSQGLDKSHKVSSTLYWYDYLTNKEIQAHASDGANYGRLNPTERVYSHIIDAEITRADTLALYWDFNKVSTTDANGQFIVDDLSEQVGSTAVPVSQKSIQLDGVDDHIIVSDQDEFSFTNGANDLPFSISAWVYVGDVASDNGPFVTKSNNTLATRNEYIFKQANGSLQFFLYDSAASAQGDAIRALANSASLTSGTWHHVVATYDGSEQSSGIKLYTDGSQTLSTNSEAGTYVRTRNTDTALTFGATEDLANANRVFEDRLADICVFNKELSPEEVQELYNYNSVLDMNNFSDYGSIISWWKMGDGDDVGQDNVIDSVGGFHGTLTNGASIINENALDSQQVYSGRFDWFTSLVNSQVTGIGTFLNGDDDQVTNREYIQSAKYRNPGVIGSEDLVEIGTEDYEVFTRNTKPAFNLFTIEKSMYQVIDDDILNLFSSIVEFNNLIGQPVNRYRMEYKSMQHFRQKYFETVKNVPSLEKYVEYYKWIDTSIGLMIRDLIPASSDFSSDLRTMVESHILERNKYWTKFPTLEMKQDPPEGQMLGIRELTYNWEYGHAEPTGQPVNLKAISFDGNAAGGQQSNTDIVIAADSDVFTFSDSTGYDDGANHLPFTLSAWVKLDTYDRGVIISKFSSPSGAPNDPGDGRFDNELIFWHLNNGQIGLVLYDSQSSFTGNRISKKTNSVLNLNEWHHVAATFDGTVNIVLDGNGQVDNANSELGMKIYVDGQEVTAANDIPLNANYQVVRNTLAPLTIGALHYDVTSAPDNLDTLYNGDIADTVIFNKALSQEEITELYNFGNVKDMNKHSAFDDIISWWKMGDDSDTATPDGIIDYVGGNHGTMSGQASIVDAPDLPTAKYTPEQNLRCLWEKERANRTDAVVSTTGLDNPESAVDTNREVIRKIATRDVKGLSQVVERNGFFVEESKPILRTESNQTYEGNTYVTRRLSKPYILTANRDKTIRAGVNYSETTKDPNAFVRTSTDIGKGLQLNGLTDNPQECVTNLSKRKYKRSSTITIGQESFDGSFVFPYYGQSNRDQSAQMTNIHSDSYGDDAEIPLQGPFADTWVGGNQHRHVPVGTEQAVRPELYIDDAGTLKHPHDVSTSSPSARYTRDELAKRPVNVENIKTKKTPPQTISYDFEDVNIGQVPSGWTIFGSGDVQQNNAGTNKALSFHGPTVLPIPAAEKPELGNQTFYRGVNISNLFYGPITVTYRAYEGIDTNGEYLADNKPETNNNLYLQYSTGGGTWITAGAGLQPADAVWNFSQLITREINVTGGVYLRWVMTTESDGDFDNWAIDDISITHYPGAVLLGNYQRDYEVVQTSSRTKNNRWFVKNNGVLPGVVANPYIADNPQYVLPDRGRHEHIFVERFSAPGDANTLSRGQLDRIAEEYSVYNSMNYRNLDDRELHHNELYTHSDLFEGSQGYYAGSAGKASIHKVNRNINYMPVGSAYDNAYISFQIPRSAEQYNIDVESGTVYGSKFTPSEFGDFWNTSNGDIPYDSDSDGTFDAISFSPANGPAILNPPSDPGVYKFASVERNQDFHNPVTVEFILTEEGQIKNPDTKEDLYLQYRIGEEEWTTEHIFLAAPLDASNYENSFQSFYFDYGQNFENPLQIRWVARTEIANPHSGIWSVSNISFTQKPFSSYELDGVIEKGNSDYADYGASGWRFTKNAEKSAVINQRETNTISVLDRAPSGKRRADTFTSHVEPAAVWHRPMKHRVFAAGEALYRTELNLLRSQDRLFNDAELNFAFTLGTRTVTHSYSNNLEVFSNPNLSKRVDLVKTTPQFMDEITNKISSAEMFYDKVTTTEVIYPKRRNVGLGKVRNRPFFDDYKVFWRDKYLDRIVKDEIATTKLGFTISDDFRQMFRQQYSVNTTDNFYYTETSGSTTNSYKVIGDLSYMGEGRYKYNITRKDNGLGNIPHYTTYSDGEYGLKGLTERPNSLEPRFPYTIEQENAPVPTAQVHYNNKKESQGWINRKTKLGNPLEEYHAFSEAGKLSGQNYAILPEYCVSDHMDKYIKESGGDFLVKNYDFLTLRGASYDGVNHTLTSGKKAEGDFYSTKANDKEYAISTYPSSLLENTLVVNCARGFATQNKISSPSLSNYGLENSINSPFVDVVSDGDNTYYPPISGINASGKFNIEDTDNDFLVVESLNVFYDYIPEGAPDSLGLPRLSGGQHSSGVIDESSTSDFYWDATPLAISIWAQPEDLPHGEDSQALYSFGKHYHPFIHLEEEDPSANWYDNLSPQNAALFSKFSYADADPTAPSLGLTFVLGSGDDNGYVNFPGTEEEKDREHTNAWTFFKKDGTPATLEEDVMNHVVLQLVPPRLEGGLDGDEVQQYPSTTDDHPYLIKMWLNSEELYGVHIRELSAAKYTTRTDIFSYSPCPLGGSSFTTFDDGSPILTDDRYPWYDRYSDYVSGYWSLDGLSWVSHFVLGNGSFHNTIRRQYYSNTTAATQLIERKFVGLLDEFAVFRGIFTNDDIKNLYNSGKPQNYNLFVDSLTPFDDAKSKEYDIAKKLISSVGDVDFAPSDFTSAYVNPNDVGGAGAIRFSFNNPVIGTSSELNNVPDDADFYRQAIVRGYEFALDGSGNPVPSTKRFSALKVSFKVYEGRTSGLYGAVNAPEADQDNNLYFQYRFVDDKSFYGNATTPAGYSDWYTALTVIPQADTTVTPNVPPLTDEEFTASVYLPNNNLIKKGRTSIEIRFLTRSEASGNVDHWAITDLDIWEIPQQQSIGQQLSLSEAHGNPKVELIDMSNNWGDGDHPMTDREKEKIFNYYLPIWHRVGISKYEEYCKDWDDEFFNSFVHTNNSPFIHRVSEQQGFATDIETRNVNLKVSAIKKLLPYEGFYPQDRTVQIANLFVQKLEGVDSYVEERHRDKIYENQAIQAVMQHFFAPGILYNSLKAGIACDWASYVNDSGLEPSYYGDYYETQSTFKYSIGGGAIESPSSETYIYLATPAPSWYIGTRQVLADYTTLPFDYSSVTNITDFDEEALAMGSIGEENFKSYLDQTIYSYHEARHLGVQVGALLLGGTGIETIREGTSEPSVFSTTGGSVITKEPSRRLQFEAILDPIGYMLSTAGNPSSQLRDINLFPDVLPDGVFDYAYHTVKVERKPTQYFLMTPEFYDYSSFIRFGESYPPEPDPSTMMWRAYIDGEHSYPYFDVARYQENGDKRYEMAIHNFLAEVPRFFLRNESLTVLKSGKEKDFVQMNSNTTYYMYISLFQSKEGFSPVFSPSGRGGQYFGPAMLWKESLETEYDLTSDAAYSAYVPPYLYGTSRVKVSFKPEESRKYKLTEIFAGLEYTNESNINQFFEREIQRAGSEQDFSTSPAWNSKMDLSACLQLTGKMAEKNVTYDPFGNPVAVEDAPGTDNDAWVIYPKFESPILNYYSESNSSAQADLISSGFTESAEVKSTDLYSYNVTNIDSTNDSNFIEDARTGTGLWSGFGEQTENVGVFLELGQDRNARENLPTGLLDDNGDPEYHGSLIDVCGFQEGRVQLGVLPNSKKITEAVVMIPFLDNSIDGTIKVDDRNFISIDQEEFETQLGKYLRGLSEDNPSYRDNLTRLETTDSNDTRPIVMSSITKMIAGMKNYNIPPRYDFLVNGGKPFAMYFFEFEHTLNKQDLQNIWQGISPSIAKTALRDEVSINHPINEHEIFGNIGTIPEGIRWMVFKVKKKASVSYYELTADSTDDERFKFDFRSRGNVEPEYSYNYPYDFFTMLDRVKVEFSEELSGNLKDQFRRKFATGEDGFDGIQ